MSEATQEQIDALFAELGIAFPLRNEITIAKALIEARVTLALATLRAEAAEAERDRLAAAVERVRALHPDDAQSFCYRCRVVSPCRTLRALDGDA